MNEFPTDDTLNTTLHVACFKHYSDQLIVDQLIARGPSAVSMKNQKRDLPLHSAMRCTIANGVHDHVFETLIKIYPEGIQQPNKDNCLPIHLGCQAGGRNLRVIKTLLEEYPLSVIMKCDLKLPFDNRALNYIERSSPSRPTSAAKYANDEPVQEYALSPTKEVDSSLSTCTSSFWSSLVFFPSKPSFEDQSSTPPADPSIESEFSPLHLAVMSGAPPDVIESIITTNEKCLGLRTDQGRRAIDCAKFAVAGRKRHPRNDAVVRLADIGDEDHIINIDSDPVQNIFAAIAIIQTFDQNRRKSMHLANATKMTHASVSNLSTIDEFDPKKEWRKLSNMIKFTGGFKRQVPALGPIVPFDMNKVVPPRGYKAPANLKHICVEIDIPVGFRRLRWAMLHSSSEFLSMEVLTNKLNYTQ